MKQIHCPKENLRNMKILPLKNNGNILPSIIYLFIENDGIDASSVEKHIQNDIIKHVLT
jgi:hypothetical protein